MPANGFAPSLPGISKTASPNTGEDLMEKLLSKMKGKPEAPNFSPGDKVAQAVQLLREAGKSDLRIAPLVNGAIQALVTGGGPSGGMQQPPAPVQGPASQAQGGGPGAMSAIASMMGGPRGGSPLGF